MCGIAYGMRKDSVPIAKAVFKRYKHQSHRGTEGFGFISISPKGKIKEYKRFTTEKEVEEAMNQCKDSEILFHHRLPTSTDNYMDTAHPIHISHDNLEYDYYVVHNGVIRNHADLKEEHDKLGFEYNTTVETITTVKTTNEVFEDSIEVYNDSESLAIDLALFFEGESDEIKSIGNIAFIALQTDKKGNVKNIHYGHNHGNPLVVEKNNDLFFLKSEGKGVDVKTDELMTIDYETKEVSFRIVDIGSTYDKKAVESHMGYGANNQSRLPIKSAVPSPYRTEDGKLKLHWDEKDWPNRDSARPSYDDPSEYTYIPDHMLGDDGYLQDKYIKSHSDEYMLSLWEELDALSHDLNTGKQLLADAIIDQDGDEIAYQEQYIAECKHNLKKKQEEASEISIGLYGEDIQDHIGRIDF